MGWRVGLVATSARGGGVRRSGVAGIPNPRGYSGHVTATQKGEEEEEEVLGFEAGEGYFRLRSTALFYSFSQPASP